MIKFFDKNPFWLIQIISWCVCGLFVAYTNRNGNNFNGIFYLFISIFISGTLTTSILRWYLKKYISIQSFRFKHIILILLGVCFATLIWIFINFSTGFIFGYFSNQNLEFNNSLYKKQKISVFLFLINGFLLIAWVTIYYGIKMLINFNTSRIDRLKLRDKIKQEQLNILKGHINPEFMFTSLNSIKELMLENVSESRNRLTQLAELLRYSLTKNNINSVVLEEELEYVKNYVDLLSIKNPNLNIDYQINKETERLEIPPMLILSMLELIIKHGVLKESNTTEKVYLSSEKKLEMHIIKVCYRGKINKDSKQTILSKSIEQRLRLLFKNKAHFIKQKEVTETSFEVQLPIFKQPIIEV